jgi:hypothetical protein
MRAEDHASEQEDEPPVAEPKRNGQPQKLTAAMTKDNAAGSQATSSGSGSQSRHIAHLKNNTTMRTESRDVISDSFQLTESSIPLPQSKGKGRAVIPREYPSQTPFSLQLTQLQLMTITFMR